jgi:hypothetical protein
MTYRILNAKDLQPPIDRIKTHPSPDPKHHDLPHARHTAQPYQQGKTLPATRSTIFTAKPTAPQIARVPLHVPTFVLRSE